VGRKCVSKGPGLVVYLIFLIGVANERQIIDMMAIQTQALLEIISSQISVDVIFAINSALML
jgi:hypothetical protein